MKRKKQNGFTLMEIMISVALLGLVIGLSLSSWVALARGAAISKQCSLMHAELRHGFDIMSKDLVGANGVHNLHSNWFGLNATSTSGVKVVYYVLADRVFYKVDSLKPQALISDVSSFEYTLYEDDGETETLAATNAFSIDVTVTTEKTVADQAFDDVFQARIMLRNKL